MDFTKCIAMLVVFIGGTLPPLFLNKKKFQEAYKDGALILILPWMTSIVVSTIIMGNFRGCAP